MTFLPTPASLSSSFLLQALFVSSLSSVLSKHPLSLPFLVYFFPLPASFSPFSAFSSLRSPFPSMCVWRHCTSANHEAVASSGEATSSSLYGPLFYLPEAYPRDFAMLRVHLGRCKGIFGFWSALKCVFVVLFIFIPLVFLYIAGNTSESTCEQLPGGGRSAKVCRTRWCLMMWAIPALPHFLFTPSRFQLSYYNPDFLKGQLIII